VDRAIFASCVCAKGLLIKADCKSERSVAQEIARDRDFRFRRSLQLIDRAVPQDFHVHVVVDHSLTKMTEALLRWLHDHRPFQLHLVPTYGWWTKLMERWFAEFANQGLGRSHVELAASINDWIETGDEDPRPFVWQKSADDPRRPGYLWRANLGSGHNHGEGD
jgi:hypothetical protein